MIISQSHFLSQSDSILKYQVVFISFQIPYFIVDHSHLLRFLDKAISIPKLEAKAFFKSTLFYDSQLEESINTI
jgi:hypothetical protein